MSYSPQHIYEALLRIVTKVLQEEPTLTPTAAMQRQAFVTASYTDNNFMLPSKREARLIAYGISQVRKPLLDK